MKHVYGPIASRRLGKSLGVALIEPKCCPLDCIYCEAGATTDLTLERREYVGSEEIKAELDAALAASPELDFITFSGAGEPTLNSKIGETVRYIKSKYPQYKLCLLTNACTFGDVSLYRELEKVDLIIPSLDASCEEEFQAVNRPVKDLPFSVFLHNLQAFCAQNKSQKILELFIAPGINDSPESVKRFAEIIRTLQVDKVQLNTLDRPGVVDYLRPVGREKLQEFIDALEPFIPVEAVGPHQYRTPGTITSAEYFRRGK